MIFTPVERMQLNHAVERVLHVPGNYAGGNLEMAIVVDCCLPHDCVIQAGQDIAGILKTHSKVFQNVRLNLIRWTDDRQLIKETSAMPLLQMGRFFEDYENVSKIKQLEFLTEELKTFYARSKLIILITDESYVIGDRKKLQESIQPFLYRKLVIVGCRDQNINHNQNTDYGYRTNIKMGIELMKEQIMEV